MVQASCRSQVARLQQDCDFATFSRLGDLIAPFAAQRGRAIRVITYPLPQYMDGVWLDIVEPAGSPIDPFLVATNATRSEQGHAIALHPPGGFAQQRQ